MAIIYTYPPLTALQGSDLLLISDTSTQNSTKSVTLANIAAYVTGSGSGTGTTDVLTRWADGPGGLLGDSIVAQDAGATTLTVTGDFVTTGTGDFTGQVTIPLTPVANTDAASKGYVDTEIAGIPAGLIFQGNWDARNVAEGGLTDQGNPDLSIPALQVTGHYYVVTTAGSATPNGPATTPNSWNVGDWVVFIEQGATDRWEKIDQTFVAGSGLTGQVTFWDSVNTVTGDNDFFWDDANKNLGIGTATPTFTSGGGIQIANVVQANVRLSDTTNATYNTDLAMSDDDFYLVNRSATGHLKFRVNSGTEAITVLQDGNVGIGTVTPTLAHLQVEGAGSVTGAFIRTVAASQTRVQIGNPTRDYYIGLGDGVNFTIDEGGTNRITVSSYIMRMMY